MTSTTDFELLFESAPISLWLEDYSALKVLFDTWRADGVTDLLLHYNYWSDLAKQVRASFPRIRIHTRVHNAEALQQSQSTPFE